MYLKFDDVSLDVNQPSESKAEPDTVLEAGFLCLDRFKGLRCAIVLRARGRGLIISSHIVV